jgi:hypothetical protein
MGGGDSHSYPDFFFFSSRKIHGSLGRRAQRRWFAALGGGLELMSHMAGKPAVEVIRERGRVRGFFTFICTAGRGGAGGRAFDVNRLCLERAE